MKKIISILIIFAIILSLSSCGKKQDPYAMMDEFIRVYGAEGIIYSPKIREGEVGYISDGLIERAFRLSGGLPDSYAVFLNSHPHLGSECGAFLCEDADMLSCMEEACLERIGLLDPGRERSFIKISGRLIFYSTMEDMSLAKKIWQEIIK